jgi:type IV pilus assembly protein PilE
VNSRLDAGGTLDRLAARGFTTIELLVAVSIVLLLLAVALASYMEHTSRKARAEARTALVELAEGLLLQFQRTGSFEGGELPILQVPREGDAVYRISRVRAPVKASDPKALFQASTVNAFTLQAVPVSGEDPCGTLLLDHAGRRGVMGPGARLAECWPGR